MGIRKYKPTTPGRRGSSVSDFVELTRSTPEKSLLVAKPKTGGRNNTGRITTRHIGGGHKQAYRIIDFKRYDKDGVPAKVAHIEYDPNRTARIALLHYADGEKRYIIAPDGVGQGTVVVSGPEADIKPGNNLPLRNIPVGTTVHAVELRPGGGAKMGRSAGASVQLVAREGNRWKGIRPTVRGVVMNPIDHPHGGGEGRTSGGRHPVSPWGKPEGRTRNKKKASSRLIVRRRKSGKKR